MNKKHLAIILLAVVMVFLTSCGTWVTNTERSSSQDITHTPEEAREVEEEALHGSTEFAAEQEPESIDSTAEADTIAEESLSDHDKATESEHEIPTYEEYSANRFGSYTKLEYYSRYSKLVAIDYITPSEDHKTAIVRIAEFNGYTVFSLCTEEQGNVLFCAINQTGGTYNNNEHLLWFQDGDVKLYVDQMLLKYEDVSESMISTRLLDDIIPD